MADYTEQLQQRPDKKIQEREFTQTPQYYRHQFYEDRLPILVCQIKVWQPQGTAWFDIPEAAKCLTIRECESIEVTDSAKELIGKAVVRFPRGTVIAVASKKEEAVTTGTAADDTQTTDTLKSAGNSGEVTSTQMAQYNSGGASTTSMAANYDDKGLLAFNRTQTEPALLSPNDVAVGNRIEIRTGYAYSEAEYASMNAADSNSNLDLIFTGFITGVSVDTPIQLECVNMAHVLNCISTPNIPAGHGLKVRDFLDDNGKYRLLKDTGICLTESSKGLDITVRGGAISDNLTVADVLAQWSKAGILCYMETDKTSGEARLRVGLTYCAGNKGGNLPNNDPKYVTYTGGVNTVKLLQFDWDVAGDNLSLINNDKKYLAVTAYGQVENKMFKLTVRKSADIDDGGWVVSDDEQFQTVNRKEIKDRKKSKIQDGLLSTKTVSTRLKDPVKLDKYNVVPYFSTTATNEAELEAEAKQFWNTYTPNGISGTLEIFGDVFVKPTDIVGLIDIRQPEKNGYYYVESVTTRFGNNGYRRELKLPYLIARFSNPVTIL